MDCETNDCRKEKRGCKGCYYDKNFDNSYDYILKLNTREELIENGLKLLGELENKDEEIEVSDQLIERQNLEIDNLKSELEIKDKMIDKMAEYLWKHLYDAEKMYICNGFNINMETCACMEEEENKCKEKIKEQFRNEVLKDE